MKIQVWLIVDFKTLIYRLAIYILLLLVGGAVNVSYETDDKGIAPQLHPLSIEYTNLWPL